MEQQQRRLYRRVKKKHYLGNYFGSNSWIGEGRMKFLIKYLFHWEDGGLRIRGFDRAIQRPFPAFSSWLTASDPAPPFKDTNYQQ